MDDAPVPVERCERWSGSARQLQRAQIVVFDHPNLVRSRPLEQTKAALKRQGGAERRLLTRCHEDELGVRMVAQAMIDIDTVGINRDRSEGQTCELKSLSGPWEAWVLDPSRLSAQAQNAER